MKKVILLFVFIATVLSHKSFAQTVPALQKNAEKQYQPSQLLASYYEIKNALVAGDAGNAALAAISFVGIARDISKTTTSSGNIVELVKDASLISKSKDITKQREYFSAFSKKMAVVVKAMVVKDKPVYYVYCPMKKAYWLSSDKEIKNPYYGSSMLTCGEISETIE